jgi:hypothetical protein
MCCLSLLGAIQPTKLVTYLLNSLDFNNDGLIQRLQLAVYPDTPQWKLVDEYPNHEAKNRAYSIIKKLAKMDFTTCGATKEEDSDFPFLHFDDKAQKIFYDWLTDLEQNKLRSEDNSALLVEHLAKYRSLMPSLALIFHLIDLAAGSTAGAVSAKSAQNAVNWCTYLESHARRIYGQVSNPTKNAAIELAKKLKKGKLADGFTAKKVYQNDWSLLTKPEIVKNALEWLVEASWLQEVPVPRTNGRPGLSTYLINPKIFSNK